MRLAPPAFQTDNERQRQSVNTQRRGALAALLGAAVLGPAGIACARRRLAGAKPISYVVPFTVGGSTDVVGRVLAQKLGDRLHQNVIVENKPGAAGGSGATYVAQGAARQLLHLVSAAPSARMPSTPACTRI